MDSPVPSFFRTGQRVRYLPDHAFGDAHDPAGQLGTVYCTTHMHVYVTFDGRATPEACKADQLHLVQPVAA